MCHLQVTSQKDRIEKTRGQLATNPKANDRMAAEESVLQGLATKLSSECGWLGTGGSQPGWPTHLLRSVCLAPC